MLRFSEWWFYLWDIFMDDFRCRPPMWNIDLNLLCKSQYHSVCDCSREESSAKDFNEFLSLTIENVTRRVRIGQAKSMENHKPCENWAEYASSAWDTITEKIILHSCQMRLIVSVDYCKTRNPSIRRSLSHWNPANFIDCSVFDSRKQSRIAWSLEVSCGRWHVDCLNCE